MDAPSIEFLGALPGIEICRATRSNHVFPRHFHDDIYAVGVMHRGASHCLGPDKDNDTVAQGQICLINPGQVHSGVPVSVITYSMLYLQVDLVRSLAEDVGERPRTAPEFTTLISDRKDLFSIMGRLALCLEQGDDLQKESALIHALGALLRAHGGLSTDRTELDGRFVRQAKELLAAELERKVTIREMAALLGVSRYRFLRAFKKQTGIPPHVFRTQRRIDLARRLVREGDPLVQIAQRVGFSDQSHFTNTFKLYTGTTPGQYAGQPRVVRHVQPGEQI